MKNYHVIYVHDDDKMLKITYQHCNRYVICAETIIELQYILFIHADFYTIVLYPEELNPEDLFFWRP